MDSKEERIQRSNPLFQNRRRKNTKTQSPLFKMGEERMRRSNPFFLNNNPTIKMAYSQHSLKKQIKTSNLPIHENERQLARLWAYLRSAAESPSKKIHLPMPFVSPPVSLTPLACVLWDLEILMKKVRFLVEA